MSAMWEGNSIPDEYLSRGGKPIPQTRVWSYQVETINGRLFKLILIQSNNPYWTYCAKKENDNVTTVRNAMSAFFDLVSGISTDLPTSQLVEFLLVIRNITNDLTKMIQ
jgi:hypothetical protein